MPAYRKAFKTFIAKRPHFGHATEMAQEFYLESDRASVILQSAAVETLLEGLLRAKMKDGLTVNLGERIFEGNGPLSTFSSKILIGYGLRFFGPVFKHDLEIIKDLRNGFAHVRLPLSLTQPEIAGMCQNLRVPDIVDNPHVIVALPGTYSAKYKNEISADDEHPRTRFTRACHSISLCFQDLGDFMLGYGGVERRLP